MSRMLDAGMLEPADTPTGPAGEHPGTPDASPERESISVVATRRMAERFAGWLARVGYESFDPYDLWGTRYGLWSRSVYYRRGILGLPFIAPILLAEFIWPSVRRFFVRKERFATADGQLILAFLNLHRVTGEPAWLEKAVRLAEEVVSYSVPGYRGLCWGYPFDWQNSSGLWRKNTPYVTSTPYCFEAFVGLHAATGDPKYLKHAASVVEFVHGDLTDKEMGPGATAASYSPNDQSDVINASAYRAAVLVEAAEVLGRPELLIKAWQNIRFILQSQREDGAWWYSVTNKAETFIDHFHTCFVLKNLFKLNRHLHSEEVRQAIHRVTPTIAGISLTLRTTPSRSRSSPGGKSFAWRCTISRKPSRWALSSRMKFRKLSRWRRNSRDGSVMNIKCPTDIL